MSTIRATNFQHASAAAPAIVLAADGTAAATVSGINGGPLAGFRNAIINGNFDVWQRGTSFTGLQYGADRWVNERNGTTCTMSRQPFTAGQADVPDNPTYFCRMVVGSITGTGNFSAMYQNIEGVRTFAGSTATVSFWIKADATKQVAFDALQYFGTGGSPSATIDGIGASKFTIGTAWQKIVHTITLPSVLGKNIGTASDDFLRIRIWFDAGSNQNAQTNALGHQSGTFEIAQVQVEAGPVATPFERRPAGTELTLCERYYEIGNYLSNYYFNNSWAPATKNEHVTFRTTKRAVPVIGGTFTGGGWTGTWSTGGATNNGFWFGNNATTNAGTFGHSATWTASAEL